MGGLLPAGLPALWDIPAWCKAVFSRREHPFLQFIRYGIAGVAAMAANLGAFIFCEQVLFPVPPDSPPVVFVWSDVKDIGVFLQEDLRVLNFIKSNAIAFVAANTVAYVLNFVWVFQGGRHSKSVEIGLFFGISLLSFTLGTLLASVFIHQGVHTYLAKGADVLTAILLNYVCRKFLIFKA